MKPKTCNLKHKKIHASCFMLHASGFTLIEILVVATIISLLATTGFVSYSSFNKSSRDARRKADLEQIRAALEMYRSNNNAYPSSITFNCPPSGSLSDPSPGTNVYLKTVPNDPTCTTLNYYYTSASPYSDYTLGAKLEGTSTCGASGTDCEVTAGSQACNYCLGPYGQL